MRVDFSRTSLANPVKVFVGQGSRVITIHKGATDMTSMDEAIDPTPKELRGGILALSAFEIAEGRAPQKLWTLRSGRSLPPQPLAVVDDVRIAGDLMVGKSPVGSAYRFNAKGEITKRFDLIDSFVTINGRLFGLNIYTTDTPTLKFIDLVKDSASSVRLETKNGFAYPVEGFGALVVSQDKNDERFDLIALPTP